MVYSLARSARLSVSQPGGRRVSSLHWWSEVIQAVQLREEYLTQSGQSVSACIDMTVWVRIRAGQPGETDLDFRGGQFAMPKIENIPYDMNKLPLFVTMADI